MERKRAFSLIELLMVIAIIAILAGLLLPAMGKAKAKGQGIQCLNNHRQLMLGWRMYNDDNRDQILYASPSTHLDESADKDPYVWVLGLMDFNPDNSSNWDVNQDIARSPLGKYPARPPAI